MKSTEHRRLKCCVIDDEPLAAQLIGSYAARVPSLELAGVFSSATEAYPVIAAGDVDLVFLDIQMPQLSGMELVKLLPEHTMVVFVTAYENYAVQGYKVNAVDYLLKPVSFEEFVGAVDRALQRAGASLATGAQREESDPSTGAAFPQTDREAGSIMVKTEYRYRQIPKSDILYVEGLKDYVRIFVEGETRSVMTLLSMKSVEHALPATDFMRVHRSYVVNLNKISMIERNRIILADRRIEGGATHEIPIGDSYRQQLQNYIASISVE